MEQNRESCLSSEKKQEINDSYPIIIKNLKKHRSEHRNHVSQKPINLERPAWVRINPAPALKNNENSYRLCIGFRNIGCKYRDHEPMGLGCLNCGYYASTAFKDVNTETIIKQFKDGLKSGYKAGTVFNSIEFLNDGSFLNDDEFSKATKDALMRTVSEIPRIKRILVESKVEYVDREGVAYLLNLLRSDQILEIGIGFESADNFIRNTIINKGFSKKDFENSINTLASLSAEYKNRLGIVVYLLVKPAFLSQKESIDDIILSLNYLASIEKKYQIKIIPKLEPAAIVNGTILSMLYKDERSKFHYKPLSYWAILEILARTACEKNCENFVSEIRIGAREDMDDIIEVPAIYNKDGKTFHPFDFVLYEAIQKFNQHHNIYRLFCILIGVYRQFNRVDLFDDNSDLSKWLCDNGIINSGIKELVNKRNRFILKEAKSQTVAFEVTLLKNIYKVLDIIEGLDNERLELTNKIKGAINDNNKSAVEEIIDECFEAVAPNEFISVDIIDISQISDKYTELFIDIKELLKDTRISIWSRIKISND
ncbi:MAG: hypothetical protein P9X24_16370 [Candidatus Hatepunaea meridiana]|nr:hypothetical protein [Candidatus Hatepunaea meridiana]